MTRTRRAFLGTLGGAVAVGSVAEPAIAQEPTTVEMVTEDDEYYFDPIGLHVEPGTAVTFENVAGAHNSVAYPERIPNGAADWETPIGETATHTFAEPGTYDYYCAPHRSLGMVGRIVVGEPGGPAAGSMPPDGDVPDAATIVEAGSVSHRQFTRGGGGGGSWLLGAGLLGVFAAAAAGVYKVANSAGEYAPVGSPAWKRRRGLE